MKTRFLDIFYETYGVKNDELKQLITNASTLEEAEELIAKSPLWSYRYATYVLRERFPKGEDAISSSGELAFRYAADIIKGRWVKGEDAIFYMDSHIKARYLHILKNQEERTEVKKKWEEMKKSYWRMA